MAQSTFIRTQATSAQPGLSHSDTRLHSQRFNLHISNIYHAALGWYYNYNLRRIVALLLAGLGCLAVWNSMEKPRVYVITAADGIPSGTTITAPMLRRIAIDPTVAPKHYVSHYRDVLDQKLVAPATEGEILTTDRLLHEVRASDYLHHDPQAAIMALPLSQHAVYSMLKPGLSVDILGGYTPEKNQLATESDRPGPKAILAHGAVIVSLESPVNSDDNDSASKMVVFAIHGADIARVSQANTDISLIIH